MKTCPYCASEMYLEANVNIGVCEFCGYEGIPYEDGKRIEQNKKKLVQLEDAQQSLFKLKEMHTADLYLLLRYVRAQRAAEYNQLRILNKGIESGAEDFTDAAETQGVEYDYWTRKVWIIENILKERMGYFPEKTNDASYSKIIEASEKSNKKIMRISKAKRDPSKVEDPV